MIGSIQHGLMKRKLCLMNQVVLQVMTGLVNDGITTDVIYLNFRRILLPCSVKSS